MVNQVKHDLLLKAAMQAKRKLDLHNRRRDIMLTVTTGFFLLMVTAITAGFIWNLGNGAAGISIVSIIFFVVSAFFTGMWIFDGWDSHLVEESEEAQQNYNNFMSEEG